MKCGVVEGRVWSVMWEVWSGGCKVRNGLRSVECEVWGGECEVRRMKCGESKCGV